MRVGAGRRGEVAATEWTWLPGNRRKPIARAATAEMMAMRKTFQIEKGFGVGQICSRRGRASATLALK